MKTLHFHVHFNVNSEKSDMLLIFNMVWPWFSCLSAVSLSRQRHDILDFSYWPLSCVLHVTDWPIGKGLDPSFTWGHHHLHLASIWISVDQLITSQLTKSCWRNPTWSKQLSMDAILGFQCGLYHVVFSLSFLLSISPCIIVFYFVHFTTMPSEPNTAYKAQRKPNAYNICPWH